jgi:hypothetical protein
MDAKFFDCGPKRFLGALVSCGCVVETHCACGDGGVAVETQCGSTVVGVIVAVVTVVVETQCIASLRS